MIVKGVIFISSRNKKSKLKNFFINLLTVLLLIIGLALVFNEQIKTFLLNQKLDANRVENVTKDDIKNNQDKDASFDFDAVTSVDFETVLAGRFSDENLYVLGGLAIPSVNLNLPVYKGLSQYAITFGAGTMKESQKMGEGNYALASHHMNNDSVLFGPLINIKMGAPMYLTDLENIYEYTVTYKETVAPTRVDLIEDVDDKKLLTLITCDDGGATRLAVQGELKSITPVKKAPKEVQKAFNLKKNQLY